MSSSSPAYAAANESATSVPPSRWTAPEAPRRTSNRPAPRASSTARASGGGHHRRRRGQRAVARVPVRAADPRPWRPGTGPAGFDGSRSAGSGTVVVAGGSPCSARDLRSRRRAGAGGGPGQPAGVPAAASAASPGRARTRSGPAAAWPARAPPPRRRPPAPSRRGRPRRRLLEVGEHRGGEGARENGGRPVSAAYSTQPSA